MSQITQATTPHLKEWPKAARALLEARYQAFVDADIDFLMESHHPEIRSQVERRGIETWAKESKWLGLKIDSEKVEGEKAFITFTARYERNLETINHSEKAEFRIADGKWYFYDSDFLKPEAIKREGEKLGRNDPCRCGSNKKFKKCCGAGGV